MPLEVIDNLEVMGSRVVRGGQVAPMLQHAPNSEMTGPDVWMMVFSHLMLRGNAYLAKLRDASGRVVELIPMNPENVHPYRDANGRKAFRVRTYEGLTFIDQDFYDSEILHIKGRSISNALVGESAITHARNTVGTQLAQTEYQARAYQDGMLIKGVLSTPERNLNPDAVTRVKDQWKSTYQGVGSSHDIAVLHSGITFQPVSMSPEDAQFIQTMKWGHTQVATLFKIPASRLNGDSGAGMRYANMTQDDEFFDKQACLPLRLMVEASLNRDTDLFGIHSPWVPKFNTDIALRADIQTRFAIYETGRGMGVLSANDVREAEDLSGIGPEGDTYGPLKVSGNGAGGEAAASADTQQRSMRDDASVIRATFQMPEQVAPVVNVSVPEQVSPVVNVAAPEVRFDQAAPVVNVHVPEQLAPVVNVAAPDVRVDVAAPNVRVEPNITIEPAPVMQGEKKIAFTRNGFGNIIDAKITEG
jgi:HK97 family phage portal protein